MTDSSFKQVSIGKEKAIALYDSNFWEAMSHRERAIWQMSVEELSMPFAIFQEAVEKTLGRPVFTHEFGLNAEGIWRELHGEKAAPSLQEIIEMIPAKKRVVVAMQDGDA